MQGVQVGLVGLLDFRIAASIALIVFSVFSIDGAIPKIARLVANSANLSDDRRQHGTKQYRRSHETGGEELSKLEPLMGTNRTCMDTKWSWMGDWVVGREEGGLKLCRVSGSPQ